MASSDFTAMFGDALLTADGERPTSEVLAGCEAVGIYFSAHWCPPCRRFTPELARVYSELRAAGKKFEIVFASSDSDEDSFNEYFKTMPWKALPFANREAKEKLSKKYKVSGIPTLVILDSSGSTITTDGRSAVMQPEKFPWIPPTISEMLSGPFVRPDGSSVSAADVADKTIGLYFSAHWCGPCRGFTPQLAKTYETMRKRGVDNFEIIFVSSDKDDASFAEYHKSMPWLALPFDQRDVKSDLSSKFQVRGIPTLVILGPVGANGDREVINTDGRSTVGNDPEGLKFPWHPPSVPSLEESSGINDTPTVVVLADGLSEEAAEAIRTELTPVADKAKASGSEVQVAYAVASPSDGLVGRVRSLLGLGDATSTPDVILVDLGDSGAWYRGDSSLAPVDAVAALVDGFKAGMLERNQLE